MSFNIICLLDFNFRIPNEIETPRSSNSMRLCTNTLFFFDMNLKFYKNFEADGDNLN